MGKRMSGSGLATVSLVLAGLTLAMAGGCNGTPTSAGSGGSSGSAGSGGSGGSAAPGTCPSGKGPPMVLLPATDGSKYCMDARETTRAEYDAFVKAKAGDTSGQPAACSWNKNFTPTLVSQDADTFPSPYYCYDSDWNNMRPGQAVGCVDFCDALAYCEWAGKRLCGQVGKSGGPIDPFVGTIQEWGAFAETVAKSPQTEFMNACTQGGKTTYPYGNSYQPGVCIDQTWVQQHGATAMDVTDTASRQCHGTATPFNDVSDLSGSVTEWQDVCYDQDKVGWSCLLSGSPWTDSSATIQACRGFVGESLMQQVSVDIGFRCCADPAH